MSNKDSTDEEIIDILLPVEDLRRENADLGAEVKRLRAGWDEAQTYMALSLEREERLRAALRNLLDYTVKANVYTDRSPTIHEAENALDESWST